MFNQLERMTGCSGACIALFLGQKPGKATKPGQWRNDVVAAASSDGGPTGGRGPRQF